MAGIKRMVSTEIEYIFTVCRSLFDLFQKIASHLWKLSKIDSKIGDLPYSFSSMVYSNSNKYIVRTPKEFADKFGLPESWAKFYIKHAILFNPIRKFREDIIHYGKTVDHIYKTERGFAVSADFKPFADLNVWNKDTFLQNNLAPLKPIVASVIMSALTVMGNFAILFSQSITLPPDIAPGYHVYMAGPYTSKLQPRELSTYFTSNCWY
jgi:hypothetical protein